VHIYLICPVRNRTDEQNELADRYVARLEKEGHVVHYPPRDVDQSDDGIGLGISAAHRKAMRRADEVHVIWDPESRGSHFDFGMAFMLQSWKKCPIVLVSAPERTTRRSYGNMLRAVARADGDPTD